MVNSKPTLKQVSMLNLLQAIEATQPPAGEKEPESKIRRLKEAIEVSRPDVIITWTCITHTRTEAIRQGFVQFVNYIHALTEVGKKELADLQAKANLQTGNDCEEQQKEAAMA